MSIKKANAPKAYLFLNGDFEQPTRSWPSQPGPDDLVIAADGGGRHVAELAWPAHCLIGDFDSIDPDLLNDFANKGAEIFRHPVHKDEIDFELALMQAHRRGYDDIEVLGALGGRWDMTFGNLFLPKTIGWGSDSICLRHGEWDFFVVTAPSNLIIEGRKGDTLSLLPLGKDVKGITLNGCMYPLVDETLKAGFSRGMSNEFLGSEVNLGFEYGTMMIVHRCLP